MRFCAIRRIECTRFMGFCAIRRIACTCFMGFCVIRRIECTFFMGFCAIRRIEGTCFIGFCAIRRIEYTCFMGFLATGLVPRGMLIAQAQATSHKNSPNTGNQSYWQHFLLNARWFRYAQALDYKTTYKFIVSKSCLQVCQAVERPAVCQPVINANYMEQIFDVNSRCSMAWG